ncbi:MAG: DegT/DnrJ/EryC1/StrS family aminotransferase [Betaproteobacteria bacterium]|nr:DegT/DnrJ/EryC1/StrS family aminotransferase [Betaproteobacteria bacterium]
MTSRDPIYVTRPYLPSLDAFIPYLKNIWQSKILTNSGPYHQQLEQRLCKHLGVEYISLFTNGTIALLTAIQALGLSGEVITTPYSFVATSHSLLWNGLQPVFVDIDPSTFNLDPSKIEGAITRDTTAILPVHCYGNPCDVEAISQIASRHNLRVVYDAAHAFGVNYRGTSLLSHGDLSILSFHATKVFNTFEGGAIVCHDKETKHRIDQLKNFGFVDEVTVSDVGINGKMSEINAAFGLLELSSIEEALAEREKIDAQYRSGLAGINGLTIYRRISDARPNFSYFPVLVDNSYPISRDDLYNKLKEQDIYARRYFYPLISEFPMYRTLSSAREENLPRATQVARQILCLPIYSGLSSSDVHRIISLIRDV